MSIAKPDYVTRDHVGNIISIGCKCCGDILIKGDNYRELSMLVTMRDSNRQRRHVTNLCQRCVTELSMTDAQGCYDADMVDLCMVDGAIVNEIIEYGEVII